ncbi:MAG: esterase-like activity of phytase family protein [Notoacmeibacter sp.]
MRFLGAVSALLFLLAVPASATGFTADISVYPIENFKIGSSEAEFGKLSFVGGFAMTSSNRNFGAVSSFRFLDDSGTRFAAISDTGYFIFGTMDRETAGLKPLGVSKLTFQQLPDRNNEVSNRKWETDSESLVMDGDLAIIGFERIHRIGVYPFDGTTLGGARAQLDFLIPERELRGNRGLETLAMAPAESPLAGSLVAISEKSIDKDGNIFAAVMKGPQKGIFKIARSDEFDITDGDFLPNGNLIILERAFGMAKGIRMRIREIDAGTIKPNAVVDGSILLEANMGHQIDNMEGLDIWQAPDGTTRLSLISDDNKSILQRNLYLEFVFSDRN